MCHLLKEPLAQISIVIEKVSKERSRKGELNERERAKKGEVASGIRGGRRDGKGRQIQQGGGGGGRGGREERVVPTVSFYTFQKSKAALK